MAKSESHGDKPCPKCGHCPTCGRSNQWYPIYPWQYRHPTYWPWTYPQITFGDSAQSGTSLGQQFYNTNASAN